jgi:hypothetical protein
MILLQLARFQRTIEPDKFFSSAKHFETQLKMKKRKNLGASKYGQSNVEFTFLPFFPI